MPTPEQIAEAWHGITDRWIVRRNKAWDTRQWEVVHDWGGDVIAAETMKLIERFSHMDDATLLADKLENEARANAVLALFNK